MRGTAAIMNRTLVDFARNAKPVGQFLQEGAGDALPSCCFWLSGRQRRIQATSPRVVSDKEAQWARGQDRFDRGVGGDAADAGRARQASAHDGTYKRLGATCFPSAPASGLPRAGRRSASSGDSPRWMATTASSSP